MELICEVDEQWSFVGKKRISAGYGMRGNLDISESLLMYFGKRDSETFHKLQRLLLPFTIPIYCTDDFKVYSSYLPRENHIIGKRYTQRIERTNLTLRSRLKRLVRKTIGFSKSEEMHDKVIGTFIEREFYH
ncbi:IS1 family transposase [Photobacterium damselae subsp. piscicida]|nr:IS1 family transposase [Photobacterium damselae subsp. piscicida]